MRDHRVAGRGWGGPAGHADARAAKVFRRVGV